MFRRTIVKYINNYFIIIIKLLKFVSGRRKFKGKPFFIHIFRMYIFEIGCTVSSIALIIFSIIGLLNILQKLIRKHYISESHMIVLLIPQIEEVAEQNSLETSLLISENNDPGKPKDCSKKSYSCYKLDTSM